MIGAPSVLGRQILSVIFLAVDAAATFSYAARSQQGAGLPAKDTIFARKTLMGDIGMHMDEIETMLAPDGQFDFAEAQEHAETVSTMLMAFPHLFPIATNQWKE